MPLERFLFKIPEDLLVSVGKGALYRIGTTLRDRATGQIVRHLQETSLLPDLVHRSLAAGGGWPVSVILQAGQLVSTVTANVQLQKVKAMLSSLQLLTRASLAASVVGIGVSAAGFALVLHRLDLLEKHFDEQFADLRRETVAARVAVQRVGDLIATRDWARTKSLLQRSEEAWDRSDAAYVWRQLEGPLLEEQLYWRALVDGQVATPIFRNPGFTLEQAVAAYELALTLASARIQTLLLLEEHAAARRHALEFHDWHERAVSGLRPIAIAEARSRQLAEETGRSEPDARTNLLGRSERFIDGAREIQLHVADRPAVIQKLMDRGIRGREYVEALRDCRDVPLLALPVSEQ
jgi:hypothetical protein